MNKYISILLVLVLTSCATGHNDINHRLGLSNFDAKEYPNKDITDGPYLFYKDGDVIAKWMEKDLLVEKPISEKKDFRFMKRNFGFELKAEWLKQNQAIDYKQEFKDVDHFIAISDIHGQYKMFVKILREYNIIDRNNNWIFGNKHLVIVGDIFDRGDQVNECLWLVYQLEHQAAELGGRVHYLIGNHEEMALNKDLRYVNEKYNPIAEKLDLSYDQLFGKNTVLGQWLRTKPVILQINDVLIVHGGVSPEFVDKGFKAEEVNKIFTTELIGKTRKEIKQDSVLKFLKGSYGPIWYRGYFGGKDLTNDKVDYVLDYFGKKNIIVGHSTRESITTHFGNRIFGVDSRIKGGDYGEVLIYDKGDFFRGTIKMSVALEREVGDW